MVAKSLAISSDARSLTCQHNPSAVIQNGSFDVEWNLPALRVEDICCSGDLSVVDFTFE
jgi:hypothetical protein